MFIKKNKNKTSGLSLVELVIASGVTAGLALGVGAYLSQQQRNVRTLEANIIMTSIAKNVEKALSNPTTIQMSATFGTAVGNRHLLNCIRKGTGCSNIATNPAQQVGFDLVIPLKGGIQLNAANIEANVIAGEANRPAMYKLLNGSMCRRQDRNRDPNCNIEVTAQFWATCAPLQNLGNTLQIPGLGSIGSGSISPSLPPNQCAVAQTINLRYRVRFIRGLITSGRIDHFSNINNIPLDKIWNDQRYVAYGAITVPVNTIPSTPPFPIACPANATMTSVNQGVPTCECIYPFKRDPNCAPGQPCACVDVDKHCAPDERYRGTEPNGDIRCCKVSCYPVPNVNSSGTSTTTWTWNGFRWIRTTTPVASGCSAGGWIESVTPRIPFAGRDQGLTGSCMAASTCKIGKWGGSCTTPVTCTEDFWCCSEVGINNIVSCNSGH